MPEQEGRYEERFTERLQEDILILLVFNDDKAVILQNVVDLSLFEGLYREVATRVYDYIRRYSKAPGEEVATIFDDCLEGSDAIKARRYSDMLTSLYESKDGVNPQYVFDRVTTFVRQQELKKGVLEAAEILHSGAEDAAEQAESIISEHLKKRLDLFDPGTFLDSSERMFRFLYRDEQTIPTGIPQLDRLKIGPAPDTLHMLIGVYGSGKSWYLINQGKHAMMARHKVCHISLEMPEDEVVKRYIQAWFAIPKSGRRHIISKFELDNNDEITGIGDIAISTATAFDDPDIRKYISDRLAKWKGRIEKRLVVKHFPTRSLTVPKLKAYLDSLEEQRGFVPDLLIIDYLDIMRVGGDDPSQHRISLGRTVEEIRGIAGERHIAISSVSQSNRDGGRALVIKGTNVAEDWSKMATADIVLTYNQTEAEQARGLARLVVDKARNERKGMKLLLTQSYETGQFCLESALMPNEYFDMIGISK